MFSVSMILGELVDEQEGRDGDALILNNQLKPTGKLQFEIKFEESTTFRQFKRQGNVERVYPIRGHRFKKEAFFTPTFCAFCNDFIYGLVGKQGMKCEGCKMVVHKRYAPKAQVHLWNSSSDFWANQNFDQTA